MMTTWSRNRLTKLKLALLGHPVHRRQHKIETFSTGKNVSFVPLPFAFVHAHCGTSTKCTYIYNHARPNVWPETVACTIRRTVRHASAISSTYKRTGSWKRVVSDISPSLPFHFSEQNSEFPFCLYIYFLISDLIFFSLSEKNRLNIDLYRFLMLRNSILCEFPRA